MVFIDGGAGGVVVVWGCWAGRGCCVGGWLGLGRKARGGGEVLGDGDGKSGVEGREGGGVY